MMKRFLFLFLLLVPGCVFAQQITITGTVKDPNGVPYTNGRGRAILIPTNVFFTTGLTNPVPGSQSPVIIDGLDANGRFSVVLTSTAAIDQQSSTPQWMFTFCSAPILQFGPICFTGPILALTSSQDITTQISAVPPPILPGGGTGGAPPAPPAGALQKAATPPVTFAASSVIESGSNLQVNENEQSKGPNPWFDITRYGARNNTSASTTATCTSGSTSVTLAAAQSYIIGDGIVLHQCGAATALSTPAAPASVTPKAILNGATTRSYKIVAEDYSLGTTAASAATTITTSAATLGLNTVTISSFTCAPTTICTWTTSGNHNLEVGARIQIAGATTTNGNPGFTNGLWYVQSTPSGTTFTTGIAAQGYYRTAGQQGSGTGGTVTVNAHNWVKWTGQNGVLRYWIYRQDGGAGNYNLVGVAQGSDPFYDDYGYAAPTAPPEIPSMAPASAQNTALATTIVSGAGTTSIVVANQAANSISGITALPDNTVGFNAAASAALAVQGGIVFVPNTSGGFTFNFPLKTPVSSNNGVLVYLLSGQLSFNQPLIPAGLSFFRGIGTNNTGTPSFSNSNYASIFGTSYPVVFITAASIVFDHVNIASGINSQSWTYLVDAPSVGGGGPTNANLIDCAVASGGGSNTGDIPIVLRGNGFNHLFDRVTVNALGNSGDFFDRPSIRITASSISSQTGSPALGNVRDLTILSGGIEVDDDSVYPATAAVTAQSWTFQNVFTESLNQPVFDFRNIATASFGNWEIQDIKNADQVNESSARHFDLSSPTVAAIFGLRIIRPSGSSTDGARIIIPASALALSIQGTTSNDLINAPGSGLLPESVDNGTLGTLVGLNNGTAVDEDVAIRLTKGAPVFVQAASPTNLSATVAAGGSLPLGTYTYAVQAVDINNAREQIVYFPTSVTTTSGNQTVNLSWTAPSPAPQGYGVYQISGPLRGSTGGQGLVSCTPLLTATTFSDTAATMCGPNNSPPSNDGGGPVGISSATGVWSNQYVTTSGAFKTTASAAALTVNRNTTWPDASGTIAVGGTAYLTSNYTNATTTLTNVTGLSLPISANTNYSVSCDLVYQTSATTANLEIAWTGPASPTSVNYTLHTDLATNSFVDLVATAFGTTLATSGTPGTATNLIFRTTMTLLNGANAGTIQLQAAATGAGTITIIPGSCSLRQ